MESETSYLEHQDWHVKILSKPKEVAQKPQISSDQKIHKQNDEGNYKTKRMDSEYGKLIQKQRQSMGLTQKELAQKINVNSKLILEIESGKAKHNPKMMNKLNNYFNKNKK